MGLKSFWNDIKDSARKSFMSVEKAHALERQQFLQEQITMAEGDVDLLGKKNMGSRISLHRDSQGNPQYEKIRDWSKGNLYTRRLKDELAALQKTPDQIALEKNTMEEKFGDVLLDEFVKYKKLNKHVTMADILELHKLEDALHKKNEYPSTEELMPMLEDIIHARWTEEAKRKVGQTKPGLDLIKLDFDDI